MNKCVAVERSHELNKERLLCVSNVDSLMLAIIYSYPEYDDFLMSTLREAWLHQWSVISLRQSVHLRRKRRFSGINGETS